MDPDPAAGTQAHNPAPPRLRSVQASWRVAVPRTALAFLFVFAMLAAGHLLMVAINAADRALSNSVYRQVGVEARWFGDQPLSAALDELTGGAAVPVADRPSAGGWDKGLRIHMLAVSPTLLAAAFGLSAVGVGLLVASRWVRSDALQSVIGVFAGVAIWTGAVEYGLMIASRLLGVAKSVDLHNGQVIGTMGEYVLLKHTWGLLLAVSVYLLFLESNRCNLFLWFRRRLPLMRGAAATGRIDNFAPRSAFQFITIVWAFYVVLLWAYDETIFGPDGVFTHALFFGSLATAGFLLLRLYRRRALGPAIRYAIGVAIVAWTPVEIAAKWGLFREPWLILSPLTAIAFFGGALLGTALVIREVRQASRGESRAPASAA